jgi:hypothetical protein
VGEIDSIALRRAVGANFGWNRLEGRRRYHGRPPLRGLQGAYVYGDVCDGRVRALAGAGGQPLRHRDLGLRLPGLVSFAESHTGELYALTLAGGVHRLAPAV